MHDGKTPQHHPPATVEEILSDHFAKMGAKSGEVRRRHKVDRLIDEIVATAEPLSREQLDRLTAALCVPNRTSAQAG